jgi:LSD1 subclass zinc finger protein
MPIRTKCPSCKTALGAPDGPPGQRVRCPFCKTVFTVEMDAANAPDVVPAESPPKQMMQKDIDLRSAPPRRDAPPPKRERSEPEVACKSSALPVGLLIGAGVGVLGLFLLLAGGLALAWLFRSSSSPTPNPPTSEEIARADGPELARLNNAGPQAVPDAPPRADGDEEFVDLPERAEDIPGVAGLNPEPHEDAGMAGERPRVAITRGRTLRRTGMRGTFFQIDYRFVKGAPAAGAHYGWVIVTARGQSYKQSLSPGTLRQQGTLQGQAPVGIRPGDSPYRMFLVLELPGLQEEKISDELVIR